MLAIPERGSNRIQLHIKANEVFEPLFAASPLQRRIRRKRQWQELVLCRTPRRNLHPRTRHRSRLHP